MYLHACLLGAIKLQCAACSRISSSCDFGFLTKNSILSLQTSCCHSWVNSWLLWLISKLVFHISAGHTKDKLAISLCIHCYQLLICLLPEPTYNFLDPVRTWIKMAPTTPGKTSSNWFEVNHVTYIMYVLKAAKKQPKRILNAAKMNASINIIFVESSLQPQCILKMQPYSSKWYWRIQFAAIMQPPFQWTLLCSSTSVIQFAAIYFGCFFGASGAIQCVEGLSTVKCLRPFWDHWVHCRFSTILYLENGWL